MASRRRTPEQNRAIYERRAARAKAAGTTYSKARREARREGLTPARVIKEAASTRRIETPAGSLVSSGHVGTLAAAIRRAADDDRNVGLRATFRGTGGWRTRDIEDWPETVPTRAPGRQGGVGEFRPSGQAQIVTHPRGERQRGFSAKKLRDLIDWYDGDVWAAIYDLWESGYFGD